MVHKALVAKDGKAKCAGCAAGISRRQKRGMCTDFWGTEEMSEVRENKSLEGRGNREERMGTSFGKRVVVKVCERGQKLFCVP